MTKSRRKSDVHALQNRAASGLKKHANGSRRKTISAAGLAHDSTSNTNKETTVRFDENTKENHHHSDDKDMTGTSHISISSKRSQSSRAMTPSKSSNKANNNRGGDAGYFYKHLPTTPLHKLMASARKKHHMTPSIAHGHAAAVGHKTDMSYMSNSSNSSAEDVDDSMNSSTDQAILDLKLALDTSHESSAVNESTASLKSGGLSHTSGSSSGGSSGSNVMNRSVLSDTTELTASNFVFTASSKQCILEAARDEKKRKEKEEKARQKMPLQEVHVSSNHMEEDLTEQTNIATLFQTSHYDPSDPTTNQSVTAEAVEKSSGEGESENQVELDQKPAGLSLSPVSGADRPTNKEDDAAASMLLSQASTSQQEAMNTNVNTSVNEPRRSLLAGPSPSNFKSRIHVSPKSLRKFTASLKRNRVQRQLERDQDIKKRLSMGSARKQALPPSGIRAIDGQTVTRFSLGSAAAGRSRQSTGSAKDQHSPLLGMNDTTGEQHWNLSNKLAQSPYESDYGNNNTSDVGLSMAAEPDSSPEAAGHDDADDTADIAFEYQQWIRDPLETSALDDSVSSVRNSRSAVMLRRLSRNKPSEMDDIGASALASKTTRLGNLPSVEDQSMDEAEEEQEKHNTNSGLESSASSPSADEDEDASKSSVGNILNGLDLDGSSSESKVDAVASPSTYRNVSRRQSLAAASTGNGADSVSNSDDKQDSPPGEIDFSSRDTSLAAPSSPTETRQSLLVRHAPNSASKLTPSRLSKKPRRIANPNSIQSPARNTRSASKQHCESPNRSMEHNLPAPSPASRSDNRSNLSPQASVALSENSQDESPVSDGSISVSSSIAARTSRRVSSVTADLSDLGDIFDFTTEFKEGDDAESHERARNQRRETASLSDFGEVLEFLEEQGGSRQSTAATKSKSRRSSMFRASLASLPERLDHSNLSVGSHQSDEVAVDAEDASGEIMLETEPVDDESNESPLNLNVASPPPSRKLSMARKDNDELIDSPARNTRSANKTKEDECENQPTSALNSSTESEENEASLDLSGLLDGLSQLSPAQNAVSASMDGIASKSGQSRYYLDNSSSSEEEALSVAGKTSPNANTSQENDDSKVTEDDNTASLSDLGSVLGLLSGDNDDTFPKSDMKRQRNSVSPKQRSEEEGARNAKRLKSSSFTGEESVEQNLLEHSQVEEELDTASLGDIEDLLGPPRQQDDGATDDPTNITHQETTEHHGSSANNESYVLSSALKKPGGKRSTMLHSARKTVNFKSPEAAEYNIGSLSSSLTPMPRNEAKALFRMPSTNEESCDMSIASSSSSSDSTVSATSPSKNSADQILSRDEKTVTLEIDMNQLMGNLEDDAEVDQSEANTSSYGQDASSQQSSPDYAIQQSEDTTIELESNVLGLLANTLDNEAPAQSSGTDEVKEDSAPEKSLSDTGGRQEYQQSEAEEMTVELEMNVLGLLANIELEGSGSQKQKAEESFDNANQPSNEHEAGSWPSTTDDGLSPELSLTKTDAESIASANAPGRGTMQPLRDRQRLDFGSPDTACDSSPNHTDGNDERTMELELNMATMLGAVGSRTEEQDFNQLDVSAIPLSSPSEQGSSSPHTEASIWSGKSQSQKCISSPRSAFAKPNKESTVQLETNVQELLAATTASKEGNDDSDSIENMSGSHEHSFTAQLEDNMAVLLKSPDEKKDGDTFEFDINDTPGNQSLKSRRSSVSSHTFSLARTGKLEVAKAGEISLLVSAEEPDSQDGETIVEFLVPTDNSQEVVSEVETVVTFDLQCEELFDLACLSKPISNQMPDVLRDFAELPQKSATEILSSFLAEACEQLESQIRDQPHTEAEFQDLVEDDHDKFLKLQQQLRESHGPGSVRDRLGSVASAASESHAYVMAIWSKDMLSSIRAERFPQMMDYLKEVDSELERNLNHIGDANTKVSLMADASARRARRKSMHRRKVAATDLEDDIRYLEAEIASATEELEKERSHEARLVETELSLTSKLSCRIDFGSLRPEAESSRARCTTLQGIFRWEPVRLSASLMSFRFIGSFPESSISLAFDIPKHGSIVGHRAKLDPSGFRPRAGASKKLSLIAASLLKRKVGEVMKRYPITPMREPSEIGPLLVNLDWQIGRLEQLAVELSAVESRYEANILFGGIGTTALEVELIGCLATFDLNARYPFEPMKMRIDVFEGKEINIVGLQRHLIKRVKPGHQYLTRLLECTETYLKVN